MAPDRSTYEKLLTLAADRAVPSLKGLKGRARHNAEIERSIAIHATRARISGMTEAELLAELESHRSADPGAVPGR